MARPQRTKLKPNFAIALFLAWLVPGAGHVYAGRVRRGLILFVTLTATFWSGMALGGVMTADPVNERWWFIAEGFTGVNGLVAWQRHKALTADFEVWLVRQEAFIREARQLPVRAQWELRQAYFDQYLAERQLALVAPVDVVARAYAGVAGMLNLLCMFDVLMLCLMGRAAEPPPPAAPQPEVRP